MMKFIVTFSLLISMLGSMACSMVDHKGNEAESIEFVDGPTISASEHNCPQQQSNIPHEDGSPCADHCHHHGHCHCGFLVTGAKISNPSLESSHGVNFDSFHPDPHLNGLFRPPII